VIKQAKWREVLLCIIHVIPPLRGNIFNKRQTTHARTTIRQWFFYLLNPDSGKKLTPDEYCRDKTAHSNSNLHYSFMFLPKAKRQALTALYAFYQETNEIVEKCSDPQIALSKLSWWRQELADTYQGQAHHPVTKAIWPYLSTLKIHTESLEEIISGVEMNLSSSRYETFENLQEYCCKTAGIVSVISTTILGYTDSQTIDYANKLGISFQLGNILRNVGEDARHNRIYLPMEDLAQFNVPAADILNAKYTENFQELMKFEAERIRNLYHAAFKFLPFPDRKLQIPGLITAAINLALLDEIELDGFMVLDHKIALPPHRKILIALWVWFKG